ncbi:MAG TPA: radical SAM protein [Methanomassiliicoccales archaeon]|nr:MAG: molybdenum cofactor biosynthesis protein A [Methanomassiliicoccales archaeon PtaB.Bin215]HNU34964.1 radical SAM protein [Methanomassiliicoccales archaeon]
MAETRRIPFLTISEYAPRVWITMSGCNLRCRGCFSIAREEVGEPMTVPQLVALVETSAQERFGKGPEEVVLTGGEPALDREYLLRLMWALRKVSREVVLQSNATLLEPGFLEELLATGVDRIIVDLKALDDEKHVWYTGTSNRDLLNNLAYAAPRVPMVVNTLLIPGFVEGEEIVGMARLLRSFEPLELEFRINPFRADLSPERMSRTPSDQELEAVAERCRQEYPGTVSSRSCLRESRGGPSKTWLTVYPDGSTERRGLQDYRQQNRMMFRS